MDVTIFLTNDHTHSVQMTDTVNRTKFVSLPPKFSTLFGFLRAVRDDFDLDARATLEISHFHVRPTASLRRHILATILPRQDHGEIPEGLTPVID
jgi:hypothetical protein